MNQGPWMRLEAKIRALVRKYHRVWMMTGPLYETQVAGLPNCPEPHTIPSGYWKIVVADDDGTLKYAAFIMGQNTARDADFSDHVVTIRQIETRSGLNFLWELPDLEEQAIELTNGLSWVQQWP